MRKVLAFGADASFVKDHERLFSRQGFEIERFNPKAKTSLPENRSVLLVIEPGLGGPKPAAATEALAAIDKSIPVIYVTGPDAPGPALKAVRERARHVLGENFLKKDLAKALKDCAELVGLREKTALLKYELDIKTSELAYVLYTAETLASTVELSKVLTKIMEHTRSQVKAKGWAVLLVDEESGELVLEAAKGRPGHKAKKYRLKPGEGIAGWAAEDRMPKLVGDVTKNKRFSRTVDRATGVTSRSIMAIPIVTADKLLGVLELVNKDDPEGFTEQDLQLVTRLMGHTTLAIERAEMYKKLEDMVITDDLTKLFNMRYLDNTLEVEIERALRYGHSVSLIFMDIDYFKNVNDQFGHLIGSKLLVELSELMLQGLRRVDIIARYGGDEFVVVLPQTDTKVARTIAERLRKSIEKHTFLSSENLSVRLTASFGVAGYPEHAKTKRDLLRLADEAMYAVKSRTRNSVYMMDT